MSVAAIPRKKQDFWVPKDPTAWVDRTLIKQVDQAQVGAGDGAEGFTAELCVTDPHMGKSARGFNRMLCTLV
jgi:hypothetical protein